MLKKLFLGLLLIPGSACSADIIKDYVIPQDGRCESRTGVRFFEDDNDSVIILSPLDKRILEIGNNWRQNAKKAKKHRLAALALQMKEESEQNKRVEGLFFEGDIPEETEKFIISTRNGFPELIRVEPKPNITQLEQDIIDTLKEAKNKAFKFLDWLVD